MEKREILRKIVEIISKETGIPEAEIRADSALMDDLDMSSLEILVMVERMETAFSLRFSMTDMQEIITVNDLVELIGKLKQQRGNGR